MNRRDLAHAEWHTSSYSSGNGQCVEIAFLGSTVATRDSKLAGGPALLFGCREWDAFIGRRHHEVPNHRTA